MFSLTHSQARSLLQTSLDGGLDSIDQNRLEEHLARCASCRAYAGSLVRLEENLRQGLHQRWDKYSPSLSLAAIQHPVSRPVIHINRVETFGAVTKFAALAALMLLIFLGLNFNLPGGLPASGSTLSAPTPAASLQTPTPLIQQTATLAKQPDCHFASYTALENETLDGIAFKFGMTVEKLKEYNPQVKTPLETGTKLTVLLCAATPTNTSTVTPWNLLESPTPMD